MLSTLKTMLGFVVTVIERYTPLSLSGDSVEDIYNYVKISDDLATSGQPNERQLGLIQAAGFGTVVNLAPSNRLENSVLEEASILEGLGVRYIHIPVDFEDPTEDDFEKFSDVMEASAGEKLWVHCAANMRVSAFVYRYRREVLGESELHASEDLKKIWEPFGVWKGFVDGR